MKKRIGKLDISYSDMGTGKVLVFLHGWGTSGDNLAALSEAFSNEYRVIVPDFPGFGGSPRPKTVWGVQEYAKLVVEFLNAIDASEPYALIGHSFGGRVNIKLLGTEMMIAEKLVLIDSAGIKPPASLSNTVIKAVAKSGKVALSAPGLGRFSGNMRKRLYESIGSTDYMNAGDMRDIFLATIDEDLSDHARNIKAKTLIIWGSEDKETPLSDARFFHSAIQNSQLKIIQGAGHFPHDDAPRKVIRLIGDFLV